MFVYYGCVFPLSTRIARGFYRRRSLVRQRVHALGADFGHLLEGGAGVTLILISHFRNIARRLEVPAHSTGRLGGCCGTRSGSTTLHIGGTGLDLGSRDEGTGLNGSRVQLVQGVQAGQLVQIGSRQDPNSFSR